MDKISLKGVIDMHTHTSPDLRARAYDDFELTDAAVRAGARAIVIKSHQGSTVERAWLCNRYNRQVHGVNSFTMFGGVTLNRAIGGINPDAVESGLRLGGKVIWLPTQSARNHLLKLKKDPEAGVDIVRDGKVVTKLNDIFGLIRDFNAVLGTAHASPEECFIVVEAARRAGVKNIVVTHPEWWIVGMRVEDQLRIVRDYDVVLERCYAQNMGDGTYQKNLAANLEIIRAAGYRNVMVSTDGGQVENPHWACALAEYMQYLADNGIPAAQIRHMTQSIPAALLGL